ncbi:hypothetical protein ISR94_03635 [Candidatus Microgenomates bacterium]|nr:hypothetical protein [Candidatus Microgenomates bacterium]
MSNAEKFIPESVKTIMSIGTPQGNIDRFTSVDSAPKNLVDAENPDPRQTELEAAFANEQLSYQSRYAKQDRLLSRLVDAETPQEVAPCIEVLRKFENWDLAEGINQYKFQNMIGQALDNADAYNKSHEKLIDEGIVKGGIDPNGYIKNGGEMRFKGYEVRIEKEVHEKTILRRRFKYKEDPTTGEKLDREEWVEGEIREIEVEKPNFFPEGKRFALGRACEELARQMIVGQKQHTETGIFDANRAALEEQVKIFFIKQIGLSNTQFEWFYKADDISKISAEQRENGELGRRRDQTMRLMRLIGHSETKDKLEKYLNETFALEMILNEHTTNRVLEIAGRKLDKEGSETDMAFIDRKYAEAARFLIGDGLKITQVERTAQNGEKVKLKQYEVVDWLTTEERDVMTSVYRGDKKHDKGADAVRFETEELKVRGFLTADGNTMSRGEKDLQYSMLGKLSLIVGDEFAVRDADRMFWTRGSKDELGPEFYAFKHEIKDGKVVYIKDTEGNFIPDLPTGEDLVVAWNRFATDKEWARWARPYLKRFSLPGEPVGSDLSKLFWTYLYRLKDQLNERPTGLLLSTDKVPRLAQSLFSLVRTMRKTVYLNEKGDVVRGTDGKILNVDAFRSIYEQWEGYKGDEYLAIEKPIHLSDFSWEQVRVPEEAEEVIVNERRKATVLEDIGLLNSKVWKMLNVSDENKEEIIKDHGGDENKAIEFMVGKTYSKDDGGVGDNADGFYKLFNFLAGDGNAEKRPWAYLGTSKIDPKMLTEPDTYTAKKKFLQIIYGAVGAFGNFRKYDRQASVLLQKGEKVKTKDLMKNEADLNISKTQKAWYKSLISHPMSQTWGDQDINYMTKNMNIRTEKLRVVADRLAQKYGYADEPIFNKTPGEFTMKIL